MLMAPAGHMVQSPRLVVLALAPTAHGLQARPSRPAVPARHAVQVPLVANTSLERMRVPVRQLRTYPAVARNSEVVLCWWHRGPYRSLGRARQRPPTFGQPALIRCLCADAADAHNERQQQRYSATHGAGTGCDYAAAGGSSCFCLVCGSSMRGACSVTVVLQGSGSGVMLREQCCHTAPCHGFSGCQAGPCAIGQPVPRQAHQAAGAAACPRCVLVAAGAAAALTCLVDGLSLQRMHNVALLRRSGAHFRTLWMGYSHRTAASHARKGWQRARLWVRTDRGRRLRWV